MPLDSYDQHILDQLQLGNPPDETYFEIYGQKISTSNASKRLTGVRKHLSSKETFLERTETDEQAGINERVLNGDGSQVSKRLIWLSEDQEQDEATILRKMGYDPLQWKLKYCKMRRAYHDVTLKLSQGTDEDGNRLPDVPQKLTNHAYNCEISAQPLQTKITTDIVRSVLSDLELSPVEEYTYKDSGLYWLELALYDFHLAKRANGYDIPLAVELWKRTILDIMARIEQYRVKLDWITLPIGNDFFHVDNSKETTTSGTNVETNADWSLMYKTGVNLLYWTIEQFRPIAKIHIDYVPGNHDETLSFAAAVSMELKYQGVDGITFNLSADPENQQKFNHYGVNLVGLTHGEKIPKSRLDTLMQDTVPDLWADTIFREWHLGHFHSESLRQVGKMKVRHIPSVTAIDKWHGGKGYRALREAQAFLWNKDTGISDILVSNVVIDKAE